MTRLTLSVPWGSGRKTFKGLPVQSSTEGRSVQNSPREECHREEVGMNDEEVLLLRGDFPPDGSGFVTIVLSHCALAVNLPQRKSSY